MNWHIAWLYELEEQQKSKKETEKKMYGKYMLFILSF